MYLLRLLVSFNFLFVTWDTLYFSFYSLRVRLVAKSKMSWLNTLYLHISFSLGDIKYPTYRFGDLTCILQMCLARRDVQRWVDRLGVTETFMSKLIHRRKSISWLLPFLWQCAGSVPHIIHVNWFSSKKETVVAHGSQSNEGSFILWATKSWRVCCETRD